LPKFMFVLALLSLLAAVASCGGDDDDDDDDDVTETAAETAEPTEEATAAPTDVEEPEPTADATDEATEEPTDDDDAALPGPCTDAPEDVLPTVLAALNSGDARTVFSCFSDDARAQFGDSIETFRAGAFPTFSEGLGSFPVDTPVIFTEEITDAPQLEERVGITAIAGDREVEGTAEDDAVYATLVVFEDDTWRMDPASEYFVGGVLVPAPHEAVPAGALTVSYEVSGIRAGGEATPDARIYFNGARVSEPLVEFVGGGSALSVSGQVTAEAGVNYVIAYVELDGGFGVLGWSFNGQ
jgi:hypothetical protein